MAELARRLAPGTMLGPYEIRGLAGAGGMGVVYRAHDLRLGRDVALKVLHDEVRDDPSWRARFEREARAAAAINHPNVVALHDVGVHDGVPYLVCELLDGETLRERLQHGPLPGPLALQWAQQIAHGLAAAHAHGLAHRDLKPANLFVTRDGVVKILDFGLAKALPATGADATLSSEAPGAAAPQTGTGAVLGTPGYMAPEQILGKPADHRADLFALGVVLFEMLAGRRAFVGGSGPDIALALLNHGPPSLPPGAPAGAERVIHHCLEKDPGARFQSARDLLFALEMLAAPAAPAAPATAPRRRRVPLLAAGLAAAVLCVGIGRWLVPARPVARAPVQPAIFERLTFSGRYVRTARLLSDGRSFVFDAWNRGEPAGIFLGRIGKPDATPLVPGVALLAVSRSDELAVLRTTLVVGWLLPWGTVARVDVTGGAPREIAEHAYYADWSPDGRDLAVVRDDPTKPGVVLEYKGKRLYDAPYETGNVAAIKVAPDGQWIAFDRYSNGSSQIVVVDLEGRERRLTKTLFDVGSVLWSADSHEIYYSTRTAASREVHAVTLDGVDRTVLGGPDGLDIQDVARDGRLLVLHNSSRVRHLIHRAGVAEVQEVSLAEHDRATDLSPDGRLLALKVRGARATGEPWVYVKPTDGGPAILIGEGDMPHLSPDGTWVVVGSEDQARLTLLPVGPGAPRELPAGRLRERFRPRFAGPDHIVFVGRESGAGQRLYIQDLAGGDPTPFSPEGFSVLVNGSLISPDGRTVVAHLERHFFIVPLDGGAPVALPGLGTNDQPLQWTEDGRALYVRVGGSPVEEICLFDVATGARTPWKELGSGAIGGGPPSLWGPGPLLSRDGRIWISRLIVGQSDLYLVTPPGG